MQAAARIHNHHHHAGAQARDSNAAVQQGQLRRHHPKKLGTSVLKIFHYSQHKLRIMLADSLAAILGVCGALLAIVEDSDYLFTYDGKQIYTPSTHGRTARYLVSLSTLFLLAIITARSALLFREKYKGQFIKNECHLFCKDRGLSYALELLICSIHPPPELYEHFSVTSDFSGQIRYAISTVFTLAMLLRVYLVSRMLTSCSRWSGYNAHSAAKKQNSAVEPVSHFFALKCMVEESPVKFLVLHFFGIVLVVAITIRACELPLYIETLDQDGHQDYVNFWNSVWLVIVTMTTVGFGDFYPRTHFGRFIDALVALAGIFLMSMVIMVINQQFQLSTQEKKVARLSSHILARRSFQKKCAVVQAHLLKYNMERMKLEAMSKKHGPLKTGEARVAVMVLKGLWETKQRLVYRLADLARAQKSRRKLQVEDEISGNKRSLYTEVTENTMHSFTTVKQLFYAIPQIKEQARSLKRALKLQKQKFQPVSANLNTVAAEVETVFKFFKFLKKKPNAKTPKAAAPKRALHWKSAEEEEKEDETSPPPPPRFGKSSDAPLMASPVGVGPVVVGRSVDLVGGARTARRELAGAKGVKEQQQRRGGSLSARQ